ncbi:hypothetical protein IQ273_09880 [Nodosilinea sp. LEGE 07298]|uniref:hypothetical protein n=1 Tax=Nodosilinea sp. LEGE 07298 TaxID=2777970 RepID=UPI0018821FE1|nr:hypothetical protein [Nodosilinea sp. LEGE 07298]MBE9109721.1 hypothetical protein [Nodosilinea sp. LEGE 07298]
MVHDFDSANSFRLSLTSLESEPNPRGIHADVQALSSAITRLSSLEHTAFEFVHRSPRRAPGLGTAPANGAEPKLYVGLQFEAPLDKFRVVLRCVGNWLDRTAEKYSFEVKIPSADAIARQFNPADVKTPPAYTIILATNQSKTLAELLPLGEALLPPQELYLTKAEDYVNTFGELTPAAKANLLLMRHRMGLSSEETSDLNARAMGPFKTLGEKYQHFRRELLVCKQEGDLDSELWQVMQAKADTMSLPEADAQFLKAERLKALRQEADRARQQAEAEAEAERQRYLEQQRRLERYRQAFEALMMDALVPMNVAPDVAQFRQAIMAQLSGPEFNRGRLILARGFYHLSPQETDALEKRVLDELYLLSGLL